MDKKSPIFTATAASVLYFIIFIMLKFFTLDKGAVDLSGALKGAAEGALQGSVIFWIVIFIVHQLLNRRYAA